jgi:hypothetical protein
MATISYPERTFYTASLVIVLLSVIWVFYVPILNGYFISDDIPWIWFAATKSIAQIFFSPVHYRAIIGSNFTPMLGISYKLDWLLFGMNPIGYYIHNLAAVFLAGAALFIFLRSYTNSPAAFTGAVLFVMSPVTLSVFGWCATRHYLEGMCFALISLYLFQKNGKLGSISILGALSYLIASLYKEIYVVLPAIAFLISQGNIRERIRHTSALWIFFLVYVLWRLWILSGMGGYQSFRPLHLQSGIDRIITFTPEHLLGSYHLLFWIVFCIILFTTRNKRRMLILLPIASILLLPIIPVISLLDPHYTWARYVFHLSIFMIFIGLLWGNEGMKDVAWKRVTVIFVTIAVAAAFAIRDKELKDVLHEERVIARQTANEFLYSEKEFIELRQPAYFYDWLRDIHEYLYGKKIYTKIIPANEMIPYLSDQRRSEILSQGYNIGQETSRELRKNVIQGRFEVDGYRVTWNLGPYMDGGYFFIRGRYDGLYHDIQEVKRKGEYIFGKNYPDGRTEKFYLKVVYRSPEGWEGITNEYNIEVPGYKVIAF